MRPNRPNNNREIQKLLAAGHKFKQEGSSSVMHLKKIELAAHIGNSIQAFQLIANGVHYSSMIIFLQANCIHKVERRAILNTGIECITQDLFFSEIEFVEKVEALL